MGLFVVLKEGASLDEDLTEDDQAKNPRGLLAPSRAQRDPGDRRGPADTVRQGAGGAGEEDPDGHRPRAGRERRLAGQPPLRSTTSSSSQRRSSFNNLLQDREQAPIGLQAHDRPTISFMISFAPPYIRVTRASAYARAIGYSSHVAVAAEQLQAAVDDAALQVGAPPLRHRRVLGRQIAFVQRLRAAVDEYVRAISTSVRTSASTKREF